MSVVVLELEVVAVVVRSGRESDDAVVESVVVAVVVMEVVVGTVCAFTT